MTGSTAAELRLAVSSFLARAAPDRRTRVCDVSVDEHEDGLVVTGVVSSHALAERLFDFLAGYPVVDRQASSVQVLSDLATPRTVDRAAVPVRKAPSEDAEQVTQVLYGDDVEAYDGVGGGGESHGVSDGDTDADWRRIGAPDGYVGWVRESAVVGSTNIDPGAVLAETVESGEFSVSTGDEAVADRLPLGSPCEVLDRRDDEVDVRFRTGLEATVPVASVVETAGLVSGDAVCATAERFLGTDYEWGGMTTAGIDCSGLVWVAYRQCGVSLPRDADQQRLVGEAVSRDELRAGDLLFFPGHVAISLGGLRYIHAHGDSGGVVVNSLDPDADDYLAEHDEEIACCRRLLGDE